MQTVAKEPAKFAARIARVGSFQSMLIDDVAMKMVRKGDDVIMIGSNAPAGETLPHIRNAAKRALDSGYTKYGPTSGLFELRQAVADKLKREYDFEADPESEILLTNGAEEAIFLAMQALVNSGDEVLQSKPSYPFDLHVNYSEGISTEYRLEERNGWKLDAERVESRVSRKTRLVTLVNPHSPTGRVFTREELEEFSEIAVKRNLFVLVDHVYSDLVYDGRRHINIANLPGMRERTVIVCSFSKSYPGMGGWRVGYAVGNRKLIAEMTKLHGLISNMGGCTFAQKGAVEAYLANQTPLSRMVRKFQRQRDASVKRLNEIKGVSVLTPEASCHSFPRVSSYGMSSVDFVYWLLKEAKIVVHPSITYNIEGYVRFNHSHPRYEEALERMEKALRKIPVRRN